ncbi:MAG: ATP-binding protein [Roseiarcus sp.]
MTSERRTSAEMLSLPRSVAALQTFALWLDGRLAELALPPKADYALRLCVEEAVMNCFHHATCPESGERPITVWAGFKDGAPAAWVEDDGPPFDPVHCPLPLPPTALASADIGGAGLRLIRHYAKQMSYRRVEQRNRLELVFDAA